MCFLLLFLCLDDKKSEVVLREYSSSNYPFFSPEQQAVHIYVWHNLSLTAWVS